MTPTLPDNCDRCDAFCHGGPCKYDSFGNSCERSSIYNFCSKCSEDFLFTKLDFLNPVHLKKLEKAKSKKDKQCLS